MNHHLLESYSISPGVSSSQRSSPLDSTSFGLPQVFDSAASKSFKSNELKKHAANLKKITLDSNLNQMKLSARNLAESPFMPTIEKTKKESAFKNSINNLLSKNSPQSVAAVGNIFFSSCNNSLVSENTISNYVKDNKFQTLNEISFKPYSNQPRNRNYNCSSFSYSGETAKLKIEEYAEKISSIHKRMIKLVDKQIWDNQINQQIQFYSTQSRLTLDKAQSRFLEIEQDLMENLVQKELYFIRLFNLIKSAYSETLTNCNNLKNQVKLLKEENFKLKIEHQEGKIYDSESQGKPIDIRNILQNTIKQTEKSERIWNVEKQQMTAQIEKLSTEIEKIRNLNNFADLKQQYNTFQAFVHAKVKELEKEIDEKDVKIAKLENLLTRTTVTYKDLQREHKELSQKHDDLTSSHEAKVKECENYFNLSNMYREIAFMSQEELFQIKINYEKLNESFEKIKKKYSDTQTALDKIKREQSEMAVVNEAEFEKDSSLLNVIKQVFLSTKRQPVALKIQNPPGNLTPMEVPFDSIPIEKYSFNKPTFYIFVQQEVETENAQSHQRLYERSYTIDRESLATVRAILDSKYNELCYYDDYRLHSSFPDFVYSWLASFYVCPIEKNVKTTNNDDLTKVQTRRTNFFKFLLNPKMNKIWDVNIFREFLEEKFAPDEIFFYLSCRYLLFQGPQLNYLSCCLNPVQWIKFEKVEYVIDLIFKKMGQEESSTLKFKLKERAKKKAQKYLIDAGFVLRILLEFYRNEKKLKLLTLQESLVKISVSSKNTKPNIPFGVFKQFIEINYPFASELEKARLYREAWYIGNGKVDYESFFIAANESNFFTESLKFFVFPKTPTPEMYAIDNQDHVLAGEINELIKDAYKRRIDTFEKNKKFARALGIESVLSSVTMIENNLTRNLDSTSEEMHNKGLHLIFSQLLQTYIKIRNQYFLTYQNSASNENQLVKSDIEALQNLMEPVDYYSILDRANQLKFNHKARKIQLYFRKKRSLWFGSGNNLFGNSNTKDDTSL